MLFLRNGSLTASAVGNGWDVGCPRCGVMTHVAYRVTGADGAPADFIASGAVLTHFECPNQEFEGAPCGYTADNVQLSAE